MDSPSPHVHFCCYEGCQKSFSKLSRLIQHDRTHTGERPYACPHEGCTKTYARSQHLMRHKETAHMTQQRKDVAPNISCMQEGCKQKFSSNDALKKHIRQIHELQLYKCNYAGCGKAFKKHRNLAIHECEHTKVFLHKCPVLECGKHFPLPSKLKAHMKVHAGRRCEVEGCGATFEKWTQLRKHVAMAHPKEFSCAHCNEKFRHKGKLKHHLLSHAESRDMFKCEWEGCGRLYCEKRNLDFHIRTFHKGNKFTCAVCEKQFATKQKLKDHMLMHDPDRPPPPEIKRVKKSMAAIISGLPRDPEDGATVMMTLSSQEDAEEISPMEENVLEELHVEKVLPLAASGSEVLCVEKISQIKDDGSKNLDHCVNRVEIGGATSSATISSSENEDKTASSELEEFVHCGQAPIDGATSSITISSQHNVEKTSLFKDSGLDNFGHCGTWPVSIPQEKITRICSDAQAKVAHGKITCKDSGKMVAHDSQENNNNNSKPSGCATKVSNIQGQSGYSDCTMLTKDFNAEEITQKSWRPKAQWSDIIMLNPIHKACENSSDNINKNDIEMNGNTTCEKVYGEISSIGLRQSGGDNGDVLNNNS